MGAVIGAMRLLATSYDPETLNKVRRAIDA